MVFENKNVVSVNSQIQKLQLDEFQCRLKKMKISLLRFFLKLFNNK